MISDLANQFEQLPVNLANHLLITILPLALGLLISLPLAILAVRRQRLRYPILAVVSIIQTIPGLALLALMVPLLVGVNSILGPTLHVKLSELGFYPTVLALTLYSMLPILRNLVTGILDVDPALREAARGVGMTSWQSLWKIELPLALPVIVAGIRTATIWTVGMATLATPVGQRCLGNYIFQGLHTRHWTAVIFGCVAAAVLAILLDLLIGGLQQSVAERRRGQGTVCASLLLILFVGGLISPRLVSWYSSPEAGIPMAGRAAGPQKLTRPIVVGCKSFTEQYILAELLADHLKAAGLEVKRKDSLGSTVIFDGLTQNEIDCYVDYTGTIWATNMKHSESAPAWQVQAEVDGWLAEEHEVRDLGPLGFENAYSLAMRRSQAEEMGIRTISDLAKRAPELRFGGDLEFFDRPEWQAVRAAYGLVFKSRTSFAPTFMYEAIHRDKVDVISAFTTEGRISAYDLLVLTDDRQAIPPYQAIVLLSPAAANSPEVVSALQPLVGKITDQLMRQANEMVDRDHDKHTVNDAAHWLDEHALR